MLSKFYQKFSELAAKIDPSPNAFLVSSIGKQSNGKSYFNSVVFSSAIVHKGNTLVDKGTDGFDYQELSDFHFLDMEGFESNQGDDNRDIFNFYSTMCISNVILFHIKHADLENRVFIERLAYLFYECFSSFKKTCFDFKNELPKLVILIRDPRFSEPSFETFEAYKELVNTFQQQINALVSEHFENYIELVENEETKYSKKNINEIREYMSAIKEQKVEFQIDEYFVIFFEEEGFGQNKKVNYYEMINKNNEYQIVNSTFESLKDYILNCKIEYEQYARENSRHNDIIKKNEYTNCEGMLTELNNIIQSEKLYEESKLSIIKNIYVEIKCDILIKSENLQQIEIFLNNFYNIKKEIDQIIDMNYNEIMKLPIDSDLDHLNNISESEKFKSIKSNCMKKVKKVIEDARLHKIEPIIFNFCQIQIIRYFQNYLGLNKSIIDSLAYQALYFITNFEDQVIISNSLLNIKKQLLLFESLYFYNETFIEILKITFNQHFNFFEVLIHLVNNLIERLQRICKSDFREHALKTLFTNQFKDNINRFLLLFNKFTRTSIDEYQQFIELFEQLTRHRIDSISNSLNTGANTQFITKKKEFFIESKYIYRNLLPSLAVSSSMLHSKISRPIGLTAQVLLRIPFMRQFTANMLSLNLIEFIYNAKQGYKIKDALIFKELSGGELSNEKITSTRESYEYSCILQEDPSFFNSVSVILYFRISLNNR